MRQLKITKSITNRENASLDKYLQEIGHEELISVEEEAELARRIKNGDRKALEKLTKANLRFVVSVAKQYQNQGLSLPDLINEGNIEVNTHQVSVDAPVSDNDATSMIDFMQSDSEPATDNQLLMESLREEIAAALTVLNERERNVVEAFYGINQPECTMEEIGKKYGLTRERVRQIREKAIRKLKQNTKNKMLKAYLG